MNIRTTMRSVMLASILLCAIPLFGQTVTGGIQFRASKCNPTTGKGPVAGLGFLCYDSGTNFLRVSNNGAAVADVVYNTYPSALSLGGATVTLTNAAGCIQERNRSFCMGAFTTPTFAAGNYTANGAMTWTVGSGDVTTYQWAIDGKRLTVSFYLLTTTVGGTLNTTLQLAIPNSFISAKAQRVPGCTYSDNGAAEAVGTLEVSAGGTTIAIKKVGAANWATSTDNTAVFGSITFEVQ